MRHQHSLTQAALAAQEALSRRGVTMDSLTHAQQFRLADGLGVDVTDLHRAIRAGAPGASRKPSRRKVAAAPSPPARDVVYSIRDRTDADQEMRMMFPATLVAVDEISDRMGLDRSKSPSLRQAYIEAHVKQLYARGRTSDGTEATDRAWQLYQRYTSLLRKAVSMDLNRSVRRDRARASVRRQGAAAAAVSSGGRS